MQYIITIVLLTLLAIAIRTDMLAHRIPNALTIVGAAGGLFLQSLHAGVPGLLSSLVGLVAGAGVMLPFYLGRGMGAGDVKLMGAVGAFIGPQSALLAASATLVLGAVLGLAFLAGRLLSRLHASRTRTLLEEAPPAPPHDLAHIRKERFPYALAIAGGTLVSMAYYGQLASLADLVPR